MSPRPSDSIAPDDAMGESPEASIAESSDRPAAGAEVSSARYEIVRKLGQGGAGAVYLARDRDTGESLALKKLLRMDVQGVLRLKREFRSVADLHHPNLIKLYDLGRADDAWFITMEYLEGSDLITFLGSSARPTVTLRRGLAPASLQEPGALGLERLAAAFQQLASGIHALHRAGMLHRDLKPSNVMVANERVIVLDFGLIRELGASAVTVTNDNIVAGTPAYMAPEQVRGAELGEATDWYAFGVMLYEALSGCLPFDGGVMEILREKLERDPTPLERLASGIPAQLCELCMALLQRVPAARPGYDEIAAVLGELSTEPHSVRSELELAPIEPTQTRSLPDALFGRAPEMAKLWQAFADLQRGRFVVAHVRGPSGAGKSALITSFLNRLETQAMRPDGHDVVVLRSRCYEREAMPFKALDGLMDEMAQYLERLNPVVASHILPFHLAELTRSFPVLGRLEVVQRLLAADAGPRGDVREERSHAEQALRELLRGIARHRPLVLWIDDVQWGDLDSATILKSWLEATDAPAALLLLSYRADEVATNPCLRLLVQREGSVHAVEHEVDLAPLQANDVEALCLQRLGGPSYGNTALIGRIVEEAQGSPFFASQLLTLAQAKLLQGQTDLSALSVEDVVAQATVLLTPEARKILNVLAIADRPVALRVALKAADVRRDGRALLHSLRNLRLTRVRVASGQQLLEIYHDRVREAVLQTLSPTARTNAQRSLLTALETFGRAEPDWLYAVARGAGERATALRYGLLAAERAEATLAFEHAAELYQQCLELSDESTAAQSGAIWLKLASALAHCRRGPRAAQAYLEAASRAPSDRAVELLRLAATHLLRSGRFEEGEALADKVLEALNVAVPKTELGLYAAIGWERARMSLRGMGFTPRAEEDVPAQRIAEGVTYASFSIDTQSYHPLRAALFQARCLRLALDVGVPRFVAGALSVHATMLCISGSQRDGVRADALLAQAETLGEGDTLTLARVYSARAVCSFLLARASATVEHADEAERLYRALGTPEGEIAGEYYHRFAVAAVRIGARFQLGQIRQATAELRSEQQEASSTENRTAMLHLTMVATIADVVEAKPERSYERLTRERPQLPSDSFGPLHVLHLVSVMWTGCATDRYAWALAICNEDWPRFQRSAVRRSAYLSLLAHTWHARLMLHQCIRESRREDCAAMVRSDLRGLSSLPPSLSASALTFLRARLAYLAGERENAVELFRQLAALCEKNGTPIEGAGARYAIGVITGGTEGLRQCREAELSLRELGVENPYASAAQNLPELF